jgi:hypothetical protein
MKKDFQAPMANCQSPLRRSGIRENCVMRERAENSRFPLKIASGVGAWLDHARSGAHDARPYTVGGSR